MTNLRIAILVCLATVWSQIQSLRAESHQCRGFRPEEICEYSDFGFGWRLKSPRLLLHRSIAAYPTPYISAQDRSARCKSLFSRYNSTATANLSFVGQNTYHNPCKVECGLCVEDELPDEKEEANVLRSYPPHMSLKDNIVRCPDEVEVFEQFMQNGVRCGPFHVSRWWWMIDRAIDCSISRMLQSINRCFLADLRGQLLCCQAGPVSQLETSQATA